VRVRVRVLVCVHARVRVRVRVRVQFTLAPASVKLMQSRSGSQSGFPLLTPIMQTYDGPAWRLIATSFVFSPKHRGALDRLPFQGFARRSGNTSF
jgi:hypothetical protein